jgi:signal transduction histidine kinase/ActR/RegA family two-component response regulator
VAGPLDITDGMSAEELRQRLLSFRSLIERAPVPIAIAHDPGCRFVSANRALASLLRLPFDANISLADPAHTAGYRIQRDGRDIPPERLPMQTAIAQRMAVRNEIEIVRPDGTVIYVQNDVEPLLDTQGRIYGCVSIIVDLTERHSAEIALREADRRKDEFLATLSHELRNPLAPIRAALEVMRLGRGDPALLEKARATMERQLQQLVRLTDDLLDVSRITQDKVELKCERVDLRMIIQSAVEAMRPLVTDRGHSLRVDLPSEPLHVDADFTRVAQAFSNLLSNAAKYTNRGGSISITASEHEGTAVVRVRDTGIGIPREMLSRIFDLFTQLQEDRDRTTSGLGVGLSLARRLVELHGGSLEAHSEGRGLGSEFVIRLPLVHVTTPEAGLDAQAQRALPAGACRVLIAEDNIDAAEMMRVMLCFGGHEVKVATDGVQAVAIAEAVKPDVAFIDIGMPRMDGYEAARRIRRVLGNRVMLVALTGWGQEEDKTRAREAGFDHHLTKPAEPEMLERMITDCAARRAGIS